MKAQPAAASSPAATTPLWPLWPGWGELRVVAFTDYLSEGSCGGVERVTREVYRRLIERGAQVRVLTAAPVGARPSQAVDGIPVVAVRSIDLSRCLGAQVCLAPGVVPAAREVEWG